MKIFSTFSLILTLLTQVSALARKSDGKVKMEISGHQLISHLDKGYHFNKDAPASLRTQDGKQENPTKKEETEIIFNTGKIEKKNFTVNFYVCDDENTVCEEHTKKFVDNREVANLPTASGEAVTTNLKLKKNK